MSARRLVLAAPAKVNLGLEVLAKRPDGFHEVDTVLIALELGDRLELSTFERRAGEEPLRLELCGPAAQLVPADGSNLAARAVQGVLELARPESRRSTGFTLVLEKHVPAASGLGGGSSDAAAAALGAALLLDHPPEDPRLLELLGRLGSDCPFFLAARASGLARCSGRGERVLALAPRPFPWSVAVVTPGFGCATADVYRALGSADLASPREPLDVERFFGSSLEAARLLVRNRLEPVALAVHPELARFRALLDEVSPGSFLLAGSGSSFFGLFADEPASRAALEAVRSLAEGRRYALRGAWVTRAQRRGAHVVDSNFQIA